MCKRLVGLFCTVILLFSVLMLRLYTLSQRSYLASAAQNQSSYLLEVDRTRGMIYDCNLTPLVEGERQLKAAVLPSPESASAVFKQASGSDRETLLARFEENRPFLLAADEPIYSEGVELLETYARYSENQLAPHVIGYINGDGQGVTGIEQGYDQLLSQYSGSLSLRYTVDAAGRPLTGAPVQQVEESYHQPGGVILTLDADIQRLAEEAAERYFDKGAVVVMDVYTGEIKAMASLPKFDPNDIAASLADPDSPMINRALWDYNVGSTFKLLVAATGIEQGYRYHTNECPGYIDVGEVRFHCHNLKGHGLLDMRTALEKSCNPYFVSLIQKTGGESVVYKAEQLGFGKALELAPGITSASGKLPAFTDLQLPGELANFGFGQGILTATPVQIAQLVAAVANGGNAITPKLVDGFTQDGQTVEKTSTFAPVQVINSRAADMVREDMISVVENGSGQKAKPRELGAGGKTGSAQTGRYFDSGEEIVQAWFAGFYPADVPQYAIVVLAEGMNSGGDYGAPVFKEICDGMLAQGKL